MSVAVNMISRGLILAFLLVVTGSLTAAGDHQVVDAFGIRTIADVRIDGLEVDKNVIVRPCRPGVRAASISCNDDPTVKVKVTI